MTRPARKASDESACSGGGMKKKTGWGKVKEPKRRQGKMLQWQVCDLKEEEKKKKTWSKVGKG
jgi:hypothetical protein